MRHAFVENLINLSFDAAEGTPVKLAEHPAEPKLQLTQIKNSMPRIPVTSSKNFCDTHNFCEIYRLGPKIDENVKNVLSDVLRGPGASKASVSVSFWAW